MKILFTQITLDLLNNIFKQEQANKRQTILKTTSYIKPSKNMYQTKRGKWVSYK